MEWKFYIKRILSGNIDIIETVMKKKLSLFFQFIIYLYHIDFNNF